MAKKQGNSTEQKEWAAVSYTDGLCGVCHYSEVNTEDNRISIISTHDDLEAAKQAAEQYALDNTSDEKPLHYKF